MGRVSVQDDCRVRVDRKQLRMKVKLNFMDWLRIEETLSYKEIIPYMTVVETPESCFRFKNGLIDYTFEGIGPVDSFDFFFDPVRDILQLWTCRSQDITVYSRNGNRCFSVWHPGKLHVLNDKSFVISDGERAAVYRNGEFLFETDFVVTKTSFLYDINKYMVQNEHSFIIIENERQLAEHKNEMLFTHYGSPVCFAMFQKIVMYTNNNYLCVAETGLPYRIELKKIPQGKVLRIDYTPDAIFVRYSDFAVCFSMFPMSLTDSTKILTTLE